MILPLLLAVCAVPSTDGAIHQDIVDDLLTRGKVLLHDGKAADALELFQQADAQTNGAFSTQQWVLRAMMETGRLNDATDKLDELAGKGQEGPGVDYLYGASSYLRAQEHLRGGTRGGNIGFHLQDAMGFLSSALETAPDAYEDGWFMLMDACRGVGEFEKGAAAAAKAVQRMPSDPRILGMAAKLEIAHGSALLGGTDEAAKAEGKRIVGAGIEHAASAASAYGEEKENAAAIADAQLQRAVGALWLGDRETAGAAYVAAMEWDPTQVDYGQLWNTFQDEETKAQPFVDVLAKGATAFEQRWGKRIASDASLQWWLGYGQFSLGKYKLAEERFLAAVEKFPAYGNAWWYTGMSRYYRQDYEGAVEAWRENWKTDRANLVGMVNQDAKFNLAALEYVVGKMVETPTAASNENAAFVAEVMVAAAPDVDRYWNNLGLFCRDAGDLLRRASKKEGHKTVEAYYERAWEAYSRAIELAPEKSYYWNDGAVILHYCLERNYDEAIQMYEKSYEMASRAIEQGGIPEDEIELVRIAKRDSKNNLDALKKKIEEKRIEDERKKKEKEKEKKGDGGGGDGTGGGDGRPHR